MRAILCAALLLPFVPAQSGWYKLAPASSPSPREQAAMVYDSVRDRVVLYGGLGASGDLDDTWEWNGATWLRMTTAVAPPPRQGHAMAFDPDRRVTVLFGGIAGTTHLDDTWLWDGTAWNQARPTRTPGAREGHAMAWLLQSKLAVLFGGWTGNVLQGDTWFWNGSDWALIGGPGPGERAGHLLAISADGRSVQLAGGWNGTYRADAWSLETQIWQRVPADLASARAYAAAATDLRRQRILLHGGLGGSPAQRLGDLHEFDGARWQSIDENTRPSARAGHQLVWLGRNGELLLFGGRADGGLSNETWLLRRPATEAGVLEETFSDTLQRDRAASGTNRWGPDLGQGILGGDGLHGDFAPTVREVMLSTDDHVFPPEVTLSGKAERVQDGESASHCSTSRPG